MSPGMMLPAVVSQNVPPPIVQLLFCGASKPVPVSWLLPKKHEAALTSVSQQLAFCAWVSHTLNSDVPEATLMPMGNLDLPSLNVSKLRSGGFAIGLGVPLGVCTSAMN